MTVVRGDAARRLIRRNRDRHVAHPPGAPTAVWTAGLLVPGEASSTMLVRRFVHHELERHHLSDRSDDTTLVVDELVANALQHGAAPVRLGLLRSANGPLTVEVTQAGPPTAALLAGSDRHRDLRHDHADLVESGRGLEIVGLLTCDWGVRVESGATCVWAVLDLAD